MGYGVLDADSQGDESASDPGRGLKSPHKTYNTIDYWLH